jgi:cytochrome P450
MALPPGPPFPAAVQTFLSIADPIGFIDWCARRYGGCFTIDTLMFGTEVCVSDPATVKRIFTGDPDVLHAGEANVILEPIVGRRSVLLLDGAEHLRHRRLMMPPFHGERMFAYARTMREVTEREIAGWPLGERLALHPSMQRVTLEIILRTVFGLDDGDDLVALRQALMRPLDRAATPLGSVSMLPPLRHDLGGFSPWAAFKREIREADALIYRQIERRRQALRSQGAGAPVGTDILSMLLEAVDEEGHPLTDAELRDELMTLLVAGHETTASQLSWTFNLLLSSPRALEPLLAELRDAATDGAPPADVGRLDYLDATLKESLRLRPVVPAVGRKLKTPMVVEGHELPEGTLLVPITYLTHRRPELYDEPEAFRPERFLKTKPDPYAWFPFGGGIRRCLGMAFALFEMKVVMATVLSRVSLRPARSGRASVRLRGFTYVPKGGAEVVVERRLAGPSRPRPEARAGRAQEDRAA